MPKINVTAAKKGYLGEITNLYANVETKYYEDNFGTDQTREQIRINMLVNVDYQNIEKVSEIEFHSSNDIVSRKNFNDTPLYLNGCGGITLDTSHLGDNEWYDFDVSVEPNADFGTSFCRASQNSRYLSTWREIDWLNVDSSVADSSEYFIITSEKSSNTKISYIGYETETRSLESVSLGEEELVRGEEFRSRIVIRTRADFFNISSLTIGDNKFHIRDSFGGLLGYLNGPPSMNVYATEYTETNPESDVGWGPFLLMSQRVYPISERGSLCVASEYEWVATSPWAEAEWGVR